jgi:hypothetical protein
MLNFALGFVFGTLAAFLAIDVLRAWREFKAHD